MATERLIVSKDPYRKSLLRRPGAAYKQLLAILVISLVANGHVMVTWGVVQQETEVVCAPDMSSESFANFLTILSVVLIVALPFFLSIVLTCMMLQNLQRQIWKVRPKKIGASLVRKISLERCATIMVAMITGMHGLLSLPYTVAWGVLLGDHYTSRDEGHVMSRSDTCMRETMYTARDVTEVVYMANYAIKFAFCVFCGQEVIGHKHKAVNKKIAK